MRLPALRLPALRLPALRLPALRLPALRLLCILATWGMPCVENVYLGSISCRYWADVKPAPTAGC
ncbi:hypothetical protein [Runella rosea]|uniref:hypothetical protein n=1 Tax=Runella rosea TaxID=2259595 RepID=UPI0013B46CED|nr:hypothetical protein [Runella rosea]